MLDSMWDVLGIALTNNIDEDIQNQALGLYALAIILTKGKAIPGIIKAESSVLKAETEVIEAETKVVAKRGSFRRKTFKDAWDNAENGTVINSKACPTCGKDVFGNPYLKEKRG